MAPRIVRALAVIAAGALLALGHAPGALAVTASAADVGHPAVAVAVQAKGYCDPRDTGSVTVVVDFSGVGGGIDIRCSSGSTGQQALANAFSYSEIASQPGFVCQIEGTPAGDCQATPPGSAYWSYWQAAPGGGWAYSSRGFGSSRVKPGGFEGWAFGSGGAPGVDPVLPVVPEPEQPAPEPQQPAAPEPDQPAAEQPAAEQPATPEPAPDAGAPYDAGADPAADVDPATDSAAAAAAAAQAAEQAAAASAAEAAAAESVAAAAAAAVSAAAASSSAASSSASSSSAASSSAAGSDQSSSATTSAGGSADLSSNQSTSGSTIWLSVVALLAVASLGTAAVVMSRRRRSGAGDDRAG